MRGIIRVGDATSHGGKVITGADKSTVMDRPVARQGDQCTCPIDGHQNCVIAEGDPAFIVAGKPAAFDGHKTSCGATLISSLSSSGRA
ncbi:PAAR domain-containing protein [Trinickia sp.]|uniref:PAAR domain-containing protein n=1 Tax=Trinickia sp. TaxID=2571163 RepID=UPI003F7EDBBE